MTQYFPATAYQHSEIEIKHSRFITHIAHTPDLETSRQFLDQIREQHPKANHNCWAYIAGSRDELNCRGSNDDGEPKGTAGKPMLNVLEHSELCEITVVVTRYFGGIKLGAGGLVRAYSQAVQEGLKQLEVTERIALFPFELALPHSLVGDIEIQVARLKLQVHERIWQENLTLLGEGNAEQLAQLRTALESFQHLTQYRDHVKRW